MRLLNRAKISFPNITRRLPAEQRFRRSPGPLFAKASRLATGSIRKVTEHRFVASSIDLTHRVRKEGPYRVAVSGVEGLEKLSLKKRAAALGLIAAGPAGLFIAAGLGLILCARGSMRILRRSKSMPPLDVK